jgi:hypothetical protein
MLQSMEGKSIAIINSEKIKQVHKHLPHIKPRDTSASCCIKCFYINETANNFCTNCGYPLHKGETLLFYQFRNKQRKELLRQSMYSVQVARVLLYVIAAFFTVGIGFLFGNLDNRFFLVFLMLASSALFFLIARWSLYKPFTALLTGFMIIVTFSTIAIFGELANTFTSVQGVYTIALSALISYFLLKGVRGAYKADLINDEMHIN